MQITQPTYDKFRIGELTIKEYDNWLLLTRFVQPTLGSLILIDKNLGGGKEVEFGNLSADALIEMGKIIHEIETKLKAAFNYDKINYQMLRMVDPEVHFHIMPRYESMREFAGHIFQDQNWPGPFSLQNDNKISDAQLLELHVYLKGIFA